MIRITEKALLIEIPCSNQDALETLHDLQTGLASIPAIIDLEDSNRDEVKWSLRMLSILLSHMTISREQLGKLNEAILKDQSLRLEFQ